MEHYSVERWMEHYSVEESLAMVTEQDSVPLMERRSSDSARELRKENWWGYSRALGCWAPQSLATPCSSVDTL